MRVKQISVFLENRAGRLREVTKILGDSGINIRALSLADTSDFGILRIIVNDPHRAWELLKESKFTLSETDVIAVEVEDKPGGLSRILDIFGDGGINVEYMYAFVEKATENAIMIFKVEDIEPAVKVLSDNEVRLLKGEEVYSL